MRNYLMISGAAVVLIAVLLIVGLSRKATGPASLEEAFDQAKTLGLQCLVDGDERPTRRHWSIVISRTPVTTAEANFMTSLNLMKDERWTGRVKAFKTGGPYNAPDTAGIPEDYVCMWGQVLLVGDPSLIRDLAKK